MKRVIPLLALFLLLVGSVWAQDCPGLNNMRMRPVAPTQQLTVSNTAVGLSVPSITGAGQQVRMAVVMVTGNSIRYRDDGTNPTASVGILIQPNTPIIVCQSSLAVIKFIRETSDAILDIAYYGG